MNNKIDTKEFANKLNGHLASDGVVQVATPLVCTNYYKKHAGMFFAGKGGELRVRQGKSSVCLSSNAGTLLVGIRMGRWT